MLYAGLWWHDQAHRVPRRSDNSCKYVCLINFISNNLLMLKFSSYNFKHTFAFSAAGLIPSFLSSLFIDMAHRVIVESLDINQFITSLLASAPIVGRHTSIIHLEKKEDRLLGFKYVWAKRPITPWGTPLPAQCLGCKCFRSWGKFSVGRNNTLSFQCKGVRGDGSPCTYTIFFEKPEKVIDAEISKTDWIKMVWP